MPITFVPERGRILVCNYDMARVPPEIDKTRRAVVMSPRSYNERHGMGPGRCVVVPFSATRPVKPTRSDVIFGVGVYETLTQETWAICSAVMSVSHSRLDRVAVASGFSQEFLSEEDLERLEVGLRYALGFP
jgi:uncharacterized protein YifN (PemK superfamily)